MGLVLYVQLKVVYMFSSEEHLALICRYYDPINLVLLQIRQVTTGAFGPKEYVVDYVIRFFEFQPVDLSVSCDGRAHGILARLTNAHFR